MKNDCDAPCDTCSHPGVETIPNDCKVALFRTKNTILPVSRLPPETLSYIFHLCQTGTTYLTDEDSSVIAPYSSSLRWLNITHVCYHWRELALDTATLWTNILVRPEAHISCVHAFLLRSKEALLRITVDDVEVLGWESFLSSVALVLPRTREFEVRSSQTTLLSLVDKLPASAPVLEVLKVHVSPPIDLHSPLQPFPISFDAFFTPSLKNLWIEDYVVDWSSIHLSTSLTHLKVVYHDDMDHPPYADIVAVLRGLPALEYLDFYDVLPQLPTASETLPAVTTTVRLPQLRKIRLAAQALASVQFLNHLEIPDSAVIVLMFRGTIPESSIPLLAPPLSELLTIQVGATTMCVRVLSILEEAISFHLPMQNFPPRLLIYVETDWMDAYIGELCTRLPIQPATVLSLMRFPMDLRAGPQSSCMRLAGYLSHVKALNIGGEEINRQDILKLLAFCISQPEAASNVHEQQPIMPFLHIVSLQWVMLRDDGDEDNFAFAQQLADIIQSRRANGSKLDRLALEGCKNVVQKDVDILSNCVDVVWDGILTDCQEQSSPSN